MKFSHIAYVILLMITQHNNCSQPVHEEISIKIKNKKLNTVFDNANSVFSNINGYISNLPTIPHTIMQLGLTASGIILLYKGGDILQNCANNLSNKKITTQDASFIWSSIFGGSMVLMGLTATFGAIKMTSMLTGSQV